MARAGARPAAEVALDGRECDVRVEGAREDDVRHVRGVSGGVVRADLLDGEGADGLRGAGRQAAVRHAIGEHLAEESLVGETAGLGARLEDVGQALGLQPLELGRVEAGGAEHVGQEAHAGVEVLTEGQEAGTRAVPRRLAADLDAEALGRLGEGGRIEVAGAGDQQLGGEGRDAGLRLVLGGGAGIGQEVDAHELALGERHEPDAQAVRERVARDVREAVRPRGPGRRSGDHAAASAGT